MFSYDFHQARDQVGHCVGRQRLFQGSEDLERAARIVPGGA